MYVLELAGQDDEFAAHEAESVASDVSRLAPGLVTARGLSDRFPNLAFTHRASKLVGTTEPTAEHAQLLLSAASITREGSVAVRAEDVRSTTGIDTQRVERLLGDQLVERGFAVDLDDPDHELRALFSGDVCAMGWHVADTERGFGTRRPSDRPYFQPGSMDPSLARALVNIAGARKDATILDPMCGTGGILIEAGLVGSRVIGLDVQEKMVRGTKVNLSDALTGDWAVVRGDASSLPLRSESIDAVVFDAPYGRQSKIEGDLETVLTETLGEAKRVTSRCVVVGDRPWSPVASAVGWTVEAVFERRVHRSLTRYVVTLSARTGNDG